jgi:DNA-binding MurR/RpiR family transcriptional regulator
MLISPRLERLASRYDDSRRSVALFLLENGERAQSMSMADIAAETGTSKPTLVRIAKQMDYGGWREFFDDWCAEYNRQAQRGSVPIVFVKPQRRTFQHPRPLTARYMAPYRA